MPAEHEIDNSVQPNGVIESPGAEVSPPVGIMDRVIEGAIGKALNQISARTVLGDPVTQGDRTVIPVARAVLNYGFGAGSGKPKDEKDAETPSSGGGGGRIRANGIGYIELTPGKARFVPIVDRSTILTTIATFAGLALIFAMPRLLRRGGARS